MSYRFVSMEKAADNFNEILTLEKTPGFFARLFGATTKTVKFHGSCTVWHTYPDFTRCGIFMEVMLTDYWWHANERAERKKTKHL